MRRLAWMMIASILAAVLAGLAAIPFLPGPQVLPKTEELILSFKVDVRQFFSLGTFWGWYNHMLIGTAVAGSIVLVSRSREKTSTKVLAVVTAMVLGGMLGAGGDALSDFICLSVARSLSSDYRVSIFQMDQVMLPAHLWPFWFSGGICVAIALAHGGDAVNWKRAGVGTLLGGFFCTIARYVAETVTAIEQTVKVLQVGNTELPTVYWSIPTLFATYVSLAAALTLAFYLATNIIRDKGIRGLNGAIEGRFWSLGEARARIGHGMECEIVLPNDGSVAENHAQIQANEGDHFVTAVNGPVVVNGANLHQAWLADGDTLQVGSYRLQYGAPRAKTPKPLEIEYALLDEMGERIELVEGENLLGRVAIDKTGNLIRVRDLSGAGVKVNGHPVATADLQVGDLVKIDAQTLRLVAGPLRSSVR